MRINLLTLWSQSEEAFLKKAEDALNSVAPEFFAQWSMLINSALNYKKTFAQNNPSQTKFVSEEQRAQRTKIFQDAEAAFKDIIDIKSPSSNPAAGDLQLEVLHFL